MHFHLTESSNSLTPDLIFVAQKKRLISFTGRWPQGAMAADDTSAATAAREILEQSAVAGVFSGAQAAWELRGRGGGAVCVGTTRAAGGVAVARDTLFDVASLTKVFTAGAALRIVARGEVAIDAHLEGVVARLRGTPQGRATLEQLLAHEAGFTDWLPLFPEIDDEVRGTRDGRAALTELVFDVPARSEPGIAAVYSDLGFIVLGRVLEIVTGVPLEDVITREVTGPLGLSTVHYRATLRSSRSERSRANVMTEGAGVSIAATEDCPWRGRVLEGEVHDDNAWAMGGVAGHAGLFATATDVARYGLGWLEALDRDGWLPTDLARRAIERRPLGRGLGWDLKSAEGSSAGSLMGPRTFGHLGFTGCSLWIDPDRGLSVALLSNRVHPSRSNEAIRELRPAFHDALVRALDG